jgi:hypothetical protein
MILLERTPDPSRERLMRVELEPFEPPVLFLPPNTVAMQVSPRTDTAFLAPSNMRVERSSDGDFRYRSGEDRGVRYELYVSRTQIAHTGSLNPEEMSRYLALPRMPDRIGGLAKTWTQSAATPLEKARAIENHLRTEYRYDLASPSGGTAVPLDDFLFDSKRGHCEFYSTAMAVMLRQVGIPSRNVTGFIGGTYNRFSRNYTVRQGDAHSWVEGWIDGVGWTTFDPTPPADAAPRNDIRGALALIRDVIEASSQRWDRHVVGYDINQQFSVYDRFRSSLSSATRGLGLNHRPGGTTLVAVLSLAVASVALTVWVRRRRARAPRREESQDRRARAATVAASLYETLDGAMVAQGLPRAQGTPPLAHASSRTVREHPLGAEILALTERYLEVRFGGVSIDEETRREYERRVKAVRGYRAKKALAGAREHTCNCKKTQEE